VAGRTYLGRGEGEGGGGRGGGGGGRHVSLSSLIWRFLTAYILLGGGEGGENAKGKGGQQEIGRVRQVNPTRWRSFGKGEGEGEKKVKKKFYCDPPWVRIEEQKGRIIPEREFFKQNDTPAEFFHLWGVLRGRGRVRGEIDRGGSV